MIQVDSYSYPADIWSIGCCVFNMVFGLRPYNDCNAMQVILTYLIWSLDYGRTMIVMQCRFILTFLWCLIFKTSYLSSKRFLFILLHTSALNFFFSFLTHANICCYFFRRFIGWWSNLIPLFLLHMIHHISASHVVISFYVVGVETGNLYDLEYAFIVLQHKNLIYI